jgi:hypothetical protein
MKIVSLNIWGGKEKEALFSFVEGQKDAEIFCFQEIFDSPRADLQFSGETRLHLLPELSALLPEHEPYFMPAQKNFDLGGKVGIEVASGQAVFVKKPLVPESKGQVFTHEGAPEPESWDETASDFVYVRLPFKGKTLTVMNFHGIAFPAEKLDTPVRLEQSRRIAEFVAGEPGEIVLIGDCNLMPDTESIRLIERSGLRNLITEYGIRTTRSRLNPFYGTPEQQNFADYAFVSPGISVQNFEVPEGHLVSDHLPLILEFD